MKKIIILLSFTFLKRDYERFGIEILKRNFQVRIIDFSYWFHFNSWKDFARETYRIKEYVLITKEKDFVELNLNSEPLIIFDFLDNSKKSTWIRNKLKNNSNIFFAFTINPIPKNNVNMTLIIKKMINLIIKPKKLLASLFNFFKNKLNNTIYSFTYDVAVVGGLESSKNIRAKKKIYAHSMDYDTYLKIRSNKKENKNSYAVFVDQDLSTHPDYKILNLDTPITEKNYYPALVKFLKNFQDRTGLNVIFATHPKSRSKNLQDLLKGLNYSIGNTAELIKDSSLVLLHSTTAISFPILFKKPIIILTSEELRKSWLGPRLDAFSKFANIKPININDDLNSQIKFKQNFKIDESKYKKYLDRYIKAPNSPDIYLWEIVTRYLKGI